MNMPLKQYRFQVLNETGQTLAVSTVTIRGRKAKFNVSGVREPSGGETADYDNASTHADGAYAEGTTIDNTTDAYLEGEFELEVTTPASADGDVSVFLQVSTDLGVTWATDGDGLPLAVLNMGASETRRTNFFL